MKHFCIISPTEKQYYVLPNISALVVLKKKIINPFSSEERRQGFIRKKRMRFHLEKAVGSNTGQTWDFYICYKIHKPYSCNTRKQFIFRKSSTFPRFI